MRWPERIFVILMFLSIALLFVFTADAIGVDRNYVFYDEVNRQRVEAGLDKVDVSRPMELTAKFYSGICSAYGKIDHGYIDNGTLFAVYEEYGGDYAHLGEVLQSGEHWAMRDFVEVVKNFMYSPPHRAVLMHEDIEVIGVGYVITDTEIYLTAYVGRD